MNMATSWQAMGVARSEASFGCFPKLRWVVISERGRDNAVLDGRKPSTPVNRVCGANGIRCVSDEDRTRCRCRLLRPRWGDVSAKGCSAIWLPLI